MYNPLNALEDQLNWNTILSFPRSTNGFVSALNELFDNAEVVASINDVDNRQTVTGYVYQLANGDVAVLSDYLGKTFTRENFEGADDESVTYAVSVLCDHARVFPSIKEAFVFLRESKQDNAVYHELKGMLDPLIKELYRKRVVSLEEILAN